jgi:hypothetical protein
MREYAMTIATHALTIVISDEEHELLQTYADEAGLEDVRFAVGHLIREYVRLIDARWDDLLDKPSAALDALIAQTHADADGGLTSDLTPDMLQHLTS